MQIADISQCSFPTTAFYINLFDNKLTYVAAHAFVSWPNIASMFVAVLVVFDCC